MKTNLVCVLCARTVWRRRRRRPAARAGNLGRGLAHPGASPGPMGLAPALPRDYFRVPRVRFRVVVLAFAFLGDGRLAGVAGSYVLDAARSARAWLGAKPLS